MFSFLLLSVSLSTNTTIEDIMNIRDEIILLRQEVASLRKLLEAIQNYTEEDQYMAEENEPNIKYPPFYNSQRALKAKQQKNSFFSAKGVSTGESYATLGSLNTNAKKEKLRNNERLLFEKNSKALDQNTRYSLLQPGINTIKGPKQSALPEENRPRFY